MIELKPLRALSDLLRWRMEVILNVFGKPAEKGLFEANRDYYARHIADGTHFAVAVFENGEECGCGGVCFYDELPSPDNPTGKCAYLMNIYVREAFRNKGIAHAVVSRLVSEAKKRGCGKIYLETTAEGKSVYSSSGFRDMPDMMIM